jgi:hypothetical protein
MSDLSLIIGFFIMMGFLVLCYVDLEIELDRAFNDGNPIGALARFVCAVLLCILVINRLMN